MIGEERNASVPLNVQQDFEVVIAFILDGVPDYRNLSAANLTAISRLDVYADPVFSRFQPQVLTFTSTWPVKDRILEIPVSNIIMLVQAFESDK